jgi:carotenoid 1,2-hydratase
MTEHAAADRSREHLRIGTAEASWRGDALELRFAEPCAPFGGRIAGRVRLWPEAEAPAPVALGPGHAWCPVAPVARAEVVLDEPALRFSGTAYHDANFGDAPLASAFAQWSWSRADQPDGTAVVYDVAGRDGVARRWSRLFGRDGRTRTLDATVVTDLPRTRWGIERRARSDGEVRPVRTLLDAPFYARTWLEARGGGVWRPMMHESLDLERFERAWVRFLLPFRMRRAAP